MGERAVIERGMETLESIGEGESTTFVLPQELSSMLGRYGKHLTGSDVREDGHDLESRDFDDETRELIGLDDIDEILGEISEDAELDVEEMEQEAAAIKTGEATGEIQDPDEVIAEMNNPGDSTTGEGGSTEPSGTTETGDTGESEAEPEAN